MKINYIYIDGYKNLNNLELSFDDNSTVNALIGNNGSGKSNVIEALTRVFTSVYNDSTVDFVYEIHYINIWSYENEWRILIKATDVSDIPMPRVSCVYLGASISDENRNAILQIATRFWNVS